MQSGSGQTRTGTLSRVNPRLCRHHPLLLGIMQALHHCPLRNPMQRVGEGVCWGASGQGLQLGYEADSQGSCRMGQRLRISTGIIKRKKE